MLDVFSKNWFCLSLWFVWYTLIDLFGEFMVETTVAVAHFIGATVNFGILWWYYI